MLMSLRCLYVRASATPQGKFVKMLIIVVICRTTTGRAATSQFLPAGSLLSKFSSVFVRHPSCAIGFAPSDVSSFVQGQHGQIDVPQPAVAGSTSKMRASAPPFRLERSSEHQSEHSQHRSAAEWRESLGMIDPRQHPGFPHAIRAREITVSIQDSWSKLVFAAPGALAVAVFTDGAAERTQKWPTKPDRTGWGWVMLARVPKPCGSAWELLGEGVGPFVSDRAFLQNVHTHTSPAA